MQCREQGAQAHARRVAGTAASAAFTKRTSRTHAFSPAAKHHITTPVIARLEAHENDMKSDAAGRGLADAHTRAPHPRRAERNEHRGEQLRTISRVAGLCLTNKPYWKTLRRPERAFAPSNRTVQLAATGSKNIAAASRDV